MARRAGVGGVLVGVSAALMKRPLKQMEEGEAAAAMEGWVRGNAKHETRNAKKGP
jgi:myo-inositol-1-phosphate synthase